MGMNRTKAYAYDKGGFIRKTCERCGQRRASEQWSISICAFGTRATRRWYAVCIECDIEFNRASLEFVHSPNTEQLMAAYIARKSKAYGRQLKG